MPTDLDPTSKAHQGGSVSIPTKLPAPLPAPKKKRKKAKANATSPKSTFKSHVNVPHEAAMPSTTSDNKSSLGHPMEYRGQADDGEVLRATRLALLRGKKSGPKDVVNPVSIAFELHSSKSGMPNQVNEEIFLEMTTIHQDKTVATSHGTFEPIKRNHASFENDENANKLKWDLRELSKVCFGFALVFASIIFLILSIRWTLGADNQFPNTLSDMDKFRLKARHSECVRLRLFEMMQYMVIGVVTLSSGFGRLHSDKKMCPSISTKGVAALLLSLLCAVLLMSKSMDPPHCECEGENNPPPLFPMCYAVKSHSVRTERSKQNRKWKREEIRNYNTLCRTVSKLDTNKSQSDAQDRTSSCAAGTVNIDPLCVVGFNAQPWVATKKEYSEAEASTAIKLVDNILNTLSFPRMDTGDKDRSWNARSCMEDPAPVCPINTVKSDTPHILDHVDASSVNLLRDIVIEMGCSTLYEFCDAEDKIQKAPCSDHVCCMLNIFFKRLMACDAASRDYFVSDFGNMFTIFEESLASEDLMEDVDAFIPSFRNKEIWVESLKEMMHALLFMVAKSTNASGTNFQKVKCDELREYFSGFGKQPNCLSATERSEFTMKENSSLTAVNAENCVCKVDVEDWIFWIQLLSLFAYSIGTMMGIFLILINCLPSSIMQLDWMHTKQDTQIYGGICMEIAGTVVTTALSILLVILLMYTAESIQQSGDFALAVSNASAGESQAIKSAASMSSMAIMLISCTFATGIGIMLTLELWFSLEDRSKDVQSLNPKSQVGHHGPAYKNSYCDSYRRLSRLCLDNMRSGKNVFDELFSYEKGKLFFEKQLVLELIEISNQIIQLLTFAPGKDEKWLKSLSTAIVLNGIILPLPFILAWHRLTKGSKWFPIAKVSCVAIDTLFDLAYLVIAVDFEESGAINSPFLSSSWIIAVFAVVLPAFGIVLSLYDIAEAARNSFLDRMKGKRSTEKNRVRVSVDDNAFSPQKNDSRCKQSEADQQVLLNSRFITNLVSGAASNNVNLMKFFLIASMSVSSVVTGSVFLYRTAIGEEACINAIGNVEFSEGASPKYVILSNLQGGCNVSSITSISSTYQLESGQEPLSYLSSKLENLTNLQSLVVKGHKIDPSMVNILVRMRKLTRLELSGPITRVADFSGLKYLATMPSFIFRFFSDKIEELSFARTSIREWDPRIKLMRSKGRLRRLDLSFSDVSYLPPSFLLEESENGIELEALNLTGTPVAVHLDWSSHGLGDSNIETLLPKLIKWVPKLTYLSLSGNSLTKIPRDLIKLRFLVSLNMSCNEGIGIDNFLNWTTFANLHDLKKLDISNIGMSHQHFQPTHMDCRAYQFIERAQTFKVAENSRDTIELILAPQRTMTYFGTDDRYILPGMNTYKCKDTGLVLRSYWTFFILFSGDLSLSQYSLINEIFRNQADLLTNKIWPQFPDAYTQRGIVDVLFHSRSRMPGGLQGVRRLAIFNAGMMRPLKSDTYLKLKAFSNIKDLVVIQAGWSSDVLAGIISSLTRLTALNINGATYNESLPAGLWKMTNLQSLKLSHSNKFGDISLVSKLVKLSFLALSDASDKFEFPAGLGMLSRLEYFQAIGNRNSVGRLPDNLSNLRWMRSFILTGSNVTGSIPRRFHTVGRDMGGLRVSLGHNRLTGTIPRIAAHSALFHVNNNFLSGFEPDVFVHTRLLKDFIANDNYLTGPLPEGFARNVLMCRFDVHNNLLSGSLPSEITQLDPKFIRWLDFSNNNFSGSIPDGLWKIADVLVCLNFCGNPLLNLTSLDPGSGSRLALSLYQSHGPGRDESGRTDSGKICKYGHSSYYGNVCEDGDEKFQKWDQSFCGIY